METVFTNLSVLPSYGNKSASVRWSVPPNMLGGKFTVRRSPDGYSNWKTLNPGGTVGILAFEDTDFVVSNRQDTTHYQIILQFNGKRYDSIPFGIFDTLSPREFAVVRRILYLEQLQSQVGDGLEVIILKRKRSGEVCEKCQDSETGQKLGSSLCDTCYGTGYVGGYESGIHSYARIMQPVKKDSRYDQSGLGVVDDEFNVVRITNYPALMREDIIVNPVSDKRYIVVDQDVFNFKSNIPVMCHANVLLLPREDIRYKVPLKNECI